MDYWGTDEATLKLLKHLGCSSLWEMYSRLHLDPVVRVEPEYVGPRLAPDTDMYQCGHRDADYGDGVYSECVSNPLSQYGSVEEIEKNYTWPSADWFDYSVIPGQIEGKEQYPIRGGGSEPFLVYKKLRGQEQAMADLVLNPEMVHYCLRNLFDFCYEDTVRIYEAAPDKVMITYVAEDFGAQEDLMYSPGHIREFLLPEMKRMIDLAHQAGAYVFHHDDGAVRKIVPDMISAGIDILNPIQWRCNGMDREGLKRDFGDDVVFHGGVDNQNTLPFGTVHEVRQEVADNIPMLGDGGGYILAPCHNIQTVSPPENVVAMYEAGLEYGWT